MPLGWVSGRDNIYMVKPGRYKWYQSRSLIPIWGFVLFGPVRGVGSFDSVIPWDTIRTLCLYEEVFVISYIKYEINLLALYKYRLFSTK